MNEKILAIWIKLKKSRTLWAYLVGAVLIFGRMVFPDFPVSDGVMQPAFLALISYILAEGMEGFRPSENIGKTLMQSRKFWVTIVGLTLALFHDLAPAFPITEEQIVWMINAVFGVNVAIGIEGSNLSGNA